MTGSEVDLDRCDELAQGIEGVFWQVGTQYVDWSSEWTTDGTVIYLCVRRDEDTLDVAGLTHIDFSRCVFPSRATIRRMSDGSAAVSLYIGEVDTRANEPPRMPPGTMILPVRDELDRNPEPALIVARKQIPITWTKVLDFP